MEYRKVDGKLSRSRQVQRWRGDNNLRTAPKSFPGAFRRHDGAVIRTPAIVKLH